MNEPQVVGVPVADLANVLEAFAAGESPINNAAASRLLAALPKGTRAEMADRLAARSQPRSTWPESCPSCGAPWRVRSKTMGAANGQPHQGTCVNGHRWYEGSAGPVVSAASENAFECVNRQSLTPAQQRVIDFLFRSGWATSRAIANHLYGNRRHAGRAALVVQRLRDAGLVEPYLRSAWHLTETGRSYFRVRP